MAGDWIKLECALWDHPKVAILATALKVDRPGIIGRLYRLWTVADQYTIDGRLADYTTEMIDMIVELPGFCDALEKVKWLAIENNVVSIPKFDSHNSASAKRRAQGQRRQADYRSKKKTS